jgi:hypothetical protein
MNYQRSILCEACHSLGIRNILKNIRKTMKNKNGILLMIMSKRTSLDLSCKILNRISEDPKDYFPGEKVARLARVLISLNFIFDSEGISSPFVVLFCLFLNSTSFGP